MAPRFWCCQDYHVVHEVHSLPVKTTVASAKVVSFRVHVLQAVVESKLDQLSCCGSQHHVRPPVRFVSPVGKVGIVWRPDISPNFVHNLRETFSVSIESFCVRFVNHVAHLLLHNKDLLISPGSSRSARDVGSFWTKDGNLCNGESSSFSTCALVSLEDQVATMCPELRVLLNLET